MQGDCGGEFTFLNCLDETLELVAQLRFAGAEDRPRHVSLGASAAASRPAAAAGPATGPGAARRRPPAPRAASPTAASSATGRFRCREIVHRLTAAGYDGFYEVELMGEEIEAADYREVLARSVQGLRRMGWRPITVSSR